MSLSVTMDCLILLPYSIVELTAWNDHLPHHSFHFFDCWLLLIAGIVFVVLAAVVARFSWNTIWIPICFLLIWYTLYIYIYIYIYIYKYMYIDVYIIYIYHILYLITLLHVRNSSFFRFLLIWLLLPGTYCLRKNNNS